LLLVLAERKMLRETTQQDLLSQAAVVVEAAQEILTLMAMVLMEVAVVAVVQPLYFLTL
jgi:hypothetical protein